MCYMIRLKGKKLLYYAQNWWSQYVVLPAFHNWSECKHLIIYTFNIKVVEEQKRLGQRMDWL